MYLWNTSFSYKTTARKRKSIRYENWILVLFLPVVSRCKYVVCACPLAYRSFVCFFPQTRALLPPLPGPGPCARKTGDLALGSKPVYYTDSGRGPLLALFPGPAGLLPGPAGPGPAGLDRSEWAERAPSSTKGSAPPFSILHPRSCISSSTNHRLCTESPRPSALPVPVPPLRDKTST